MKDAEAKKKAQDRQVKENSIKVAFKKPYHQVEEQEVHVTVTQGEPKKTISYELNITEHSRYSNSKTEVVSLNCTLKEFQKHKKDALRIVTEELNQEEAKRVKLDKLYPGKTKSEAIRLVEEKAVAEALK